MPRPCTCDHIDLNDPLHCRACWLWHNPEDVWGRYYHDLWSGEATATPPQNVLLIHDPAPMPTEGPGTELKNLLQSLGFDASLACGCQALANKMNQWGIEGCQDNREQILMHLRQAMERLNWKQKFLAGVAATLKGLAFKLDPLDPCPGLLDEAVRASRRQPHHQGPLEE